MAETKDTGTGEPLQTVGDALDGDGLEKLAKWMDEDSKPTVQEAPKQEAQPEVPAEQPAQEETNDLSQSTPEETPEDDPVDDAEPITKERIQKRFNQLTAKAKAESERADAVQAELEQTKARQAELEAKLQELENAPPQQQAKPPLVPETQKLLDAENEYAKAARTARELLRKLEESPDETLEELRTKAKLEFPSPTAAKWWLDEQRELAKEKQLEARRQREVAEDGVRKQIEARVSEARKQAVKTYPWLEKPSKDQQEIINRLRKEFNGIDNAPLVLARLVAAELAERKPAAPIIPPKSAPARTVPAAARSDGKPSISQKREKLIQAGGKEEALAQFFS